MVSAQSRAPLSATHSELRVLRSTFVLCCVVQRAQSNGCVMDAGKCRWLHAEALGESLTACNWHPCHHRPYSRFASPAHVLLTQTRAMSGRSELWMRASQGRRIQHPTTDANEAQSPLRVVLSNGPRLLTRACVQPLQTHNPSVHAVLEWWAVQSCTGIDDTSGQRCASLPSCCFLHQDSEASWVSMM
jgi:hypothetical protein